MKTKIKVYLPIRIVFVVTSRHGADVGLLGWQISGDPVLEVVPGQVVLQVTVRVLGRSLELAQRTNLDCVLSGVSGNSCNNSRIINTIRIKSSENKQQPGASRSGLLSVERLVFCFILISCFLHIQA